jgi:hypothetical protein
VNNRFIGVGFSEYYFVHHRKLWVYSFLTINNLSSLGKGKITNGVMIEGTVSRRRLFANLPNYDERLVRRVDKNLYNYLHFYDVTYNWQHLIIYLGFVVTDVLRSK